MNIICQFDRWRFLAITLFLIQVNYPGIAGNVALVQGTISLPNAAERQYSLRLTETMSRWLNSLGINHKILKDEDVSEHTLQESKIAVLIYNANLLRNEITAFQKFVSRGGKLVVFYSSDPELAKLMGIKLGNYLAAKSHNQWAAFKMNEKAPPHMPIRVSQISRNIRLAEPISGKSVVIGYWEDSTKVPSQYPAWLFSNKGFWMTHVLLDDGDSLNKKQLLLALLGWCDPGLWKVAAKASLKNVGTIGKYSNLEEALQTLESSKAAPSRRLSEKAILNSREHYLEASTMMARGDYASVIQTCNLINQIIVTEYCRIHTPLPIDMLGVWNHSGMGLYVGNWRKTCEILKSYGFTDIFPNFAWPGNVHYESNIQPSSDIHRLYGDQLAQCVLETHAVGLKVHVWKVCWNLDRAPKTFIERLQKAKRLQVSNAGRIIKWLCPSVPKNRFYEKEAIRELIQKYAIDGIHLDYIRYPDKGSCFCLNCRKQFESHIKHHITHWPRDVHNGPFKSAYTTWRTSQITKFVRDVSILAKKLSPEIKISAAVYGLYPQCIESVGQDWRKWLRKGYVDFVCPMNYTDDTSKFLKWSQNQLGIRNMRKRIYPGIGCTASKTRLNAVQTIDQITIAKNMGASGVVLFDLTPVLEKEVLPYINPPEENNGD